MEFLIFFAVYSFAYHLEQIYCFYSKKHKWGYLVPDPNVIEIDGASLDEHGELKLRINSNMEKVLADMKKKHKDTDPPLFPLKYVLLKK